MGIHRVVVAVFLAEVLSLGLGGETAATNKLRSELLSSLEVADTADAPTTLEEARNNLIEQEKQYLAKKCISFGVCGEKTGKTCTRGFCCSREGYCWNENSPVCGPRYRPQMQFSGTHCSDQTELQAYKEGLTAYDHLASGGAEATFESAEAAKKAMEEAQEEMYKGECIYQGKCGHETGKVCAGQKCCTKWGFCWPKESAQCVPEKEFQLKYSWPFCSETAAQGKYEKAKAAYEQMSGGK